MTVEFIRMLETEKLQAAEQLGVERAAQLRDRVHELKKKIGQPVPKDKGSDALRFAKKKAAAGRDAGRGSTMSIFDQNRKSSFDFQLVFCRFPIQAECVSNVFFCVTCIDPIQEESCQSEVGLREATQVTVSIRS